MAGALLAIASNTRHKIRLYAHTALTQSSVGLLVCLASDSALLNLGPKNLRLLCVRLLPQQSRGLHHAETSAGADGAAPGRGSQHNRRRLGDSQLGAEKVHQRAPPTINRTPPCCPRPSSMRMLASPQLHGIRGTSASSQRGCGACACLLFAAFSHVYLVDKRSSVMHKTLWS